MASSVGFFCRTKLFIALLFVLVIAFTLRLFAAGRGNFFQRWNVFSIRYDSLKCEKCALVTNSGHSIGSNLGKQIDEHDCVFRINDAPTRYYEDDVGSKTTVRVVVFEELINTLRKLTAKESLAQVLYIYHREMRHESEIRHESLKDVLDVSVHTMSMEERDRINAALLETVRLRAIAEPTTGLVAFLIALEKCNAELNVYGLVPPHHCEKYRGYYDAPRDYFPPGDEVPSCPAKNLSSLKFSRSHFYNKETLIVRHFVRVYENVNFFSPPWPAQ